MKLSLAIADTDALPSAFVVFRGIEQSIRKAATLGYQGVELALKSADEVDPPRLDRWLADSGMEVSGISTGQIFAGLGLTLTDADPARRAETIVLFKALIELAATYGQRVNIGRVRGSIGQRDPGLVEQLFVDAARELCDYATPRGVTLLLEPVNRYEIDFINNVEEGVALLARIDRPGMKLMPDVFHMNIEDARIGETLARHVAHIGYLHLADSNRLAPGAGHLDFDAIFSHLKQAGYHGWAAVEILPRPDPDTAASDAATFLLPYLKRYADDQ